MNEYSTIKIEERDDGIAILTMNRPERLNAINYELIEEFLDYMDKLERNLNIRVLILAAEGRAFSAGLDLKEVNMLKIRKIPEEFKKYDYLNVKEPMKRMVIFQYLLSKMMKRLREIPQPVIAAVQGHAYGAGFTLALASDIRIAGESVKFCNAFINIGVSGADCSSSYWLPRLVGFSRAAEIMYTGKEVDADESNRIGLVSRVLPDDQILNEAIKIGKKMLTKSPMGLRFTKDALNVNIDAPSLESAIKFENQTQSVCFTSKDTEEAIYAVLEKREAVFGKWVKDNQ